MAKQTKRSLLDGIQESVAQTPHGGTPSTGSGPPRYLLATLLSAAALSLLASSIFIPSLPYMARDLQTSLGNVQLTITVYLLAFGLTALFVGALSDYVGRRVVLLASFALFCFSSAACALAPTIEMLLAARVVQAIGACAGIVVTRATVRDIYGRDGTPRVMSILSISMILMPILGSILGGYLQTWFGWRANFIVLVGGSALLLAAMWLHLPRSGPKSDEFKNLVSTHFTVNILLLLRQSSFVGYTGVIIASGAAAFSFTSVAPVILIEYLGVTPLIFGWLAALICSSTLAGLLVTNLLVVRTGINRLILVGSGLLFASGVATVALSPIPRVWAVVAPLVLMHFAIGLLAPNGHSGAIGSRPEIAGAASGLSVLFQMAFAGVATGIMAATRHDTSLSFGVLILTLGLVAFAGLRLTRDS